MAQITFTVADIDVPRIVAAFEYRFGQKDPEETTGQFVKRHIIEMLQNWTRDVEAEKVRMAEFNGYVNLDVT